MAKRSPETFIKRQREMDKKRKAQQKRDRRFERRDRPPADDLILDPNGDVINRPQRPPRHERHPEDDDHFGQR